MNENIKAFLAKVEASPDLQTQLSQLRDPDEAYKLAASVQDGFTKDEFVSEMTKLYEAQVADLSDEDISKIAGGTSDSVVYSLATTTISASVTALAGMAAW